MKRFLSTNWNRATLNHFFLIVVGMKNCHTPQLQSRGECRTIRVVSGDSCGALTTKCGITPAQFTEYNTFCGMVALAQYEPVPVRDSYSLARHHLAVFPL